MEVIEGGLAFEVPEDDDAVFFNPAMELNRDITIAVLRAMRSQIDRDRELTYLDAMTATGIRGVRAAVEGYDVTACDIDPAAIDLATDHLRRHDVDGEIVHDDARRHLLDHRYDVVDIDPFGSPVSFLDAAFAGTRDLMCVTATDTAPLCGAHFRAGVRRYGAIPVNTEYHAEVGVRILIGAIVRAAARFDIAAIPRLAHATRHYVRVYVGLERQATRADACIGGLGFLVHCPSCLHRHSVKGLAPALPESCPACDAPVRRIGPMWLDSYVEHDWLDAVAANLDSTMGEATAARRLLERLTAELDTPSHFDHHKICDRLEIPAAPLDAVFEAIETSGHTVSRTHYGGTTFKTDAPIETIKRAIESLSETT